MADSENDSLSVEDLLVAFGSPAPTSKSTTKVSASKSAAADAPSMNEDEIDLLSALGLGSRPSAAMPSPAQGRAQVDHSRADRESFKDAARKEQQIRAQQWQQELRRREARMARTQTASEEAAEAEQMSPGQSDLPFMEEGGLSKSPSAPEFPELKSGGFESPGAYEPYKIPEPSFLASKGQAFPAEGAAANSAISDQVQQGAAKTYDRSGQVRPGAQSATQEGFQNEATEQQAHDGYAPIAQSSQQPSHFQPASQMQQPDRFNPVNQPVQQPTEQPFHNIAPIADQASNIQPVQELQQHGDQGMPAPDADQRSFVQVSELPSFVRSPELRPFGSSVASEANTFNRRIIEPLSQQNPDASQEGNQTPRFADLDHSQEEFAEPATQGIQEQMPADVSNPAEHNAPAIVEQRPFQSSSEGVVKRSFFPGGSSISSIQRLDETQPPTSSADQESFVERKQVPLSDSTDALSTGMLGSIQPMIGASPDAGDPYQETPAAHEQPAFEQPIFEQPTFEYQASEAMQYDQPQQQSAESASFDQMPSAESPIGSAVPFQGESTQFDASMSQTFEPVEQGIATDQLQDFPTGQITDSFQDVAPQGAYAPQQPIAPIAPPYPAASVQDDQFDIDRQQASSKRNNILGIILIVVALLCAVMAIGMLSGLFNMNSSTQGGASSATTASSGAPVSDVAADPNSTQAVYTYVVRGVDGSTHEATETATFNADGFLEGSTITLEVENAEVANALLEQLKSEFGASVVNSEADDNHVLIDLDINRDDLTKEAYTELLLANMTEFKQVS